MDNRHRKIVGNGDARLLLSPCDSGPTTTKRTPDLLVLKTCFERKGQMVYLHYNLKNKREMCVYKTHSDDTESSDQSHF